jgi:hypothetical protein
MTLGLAPRQTDLSRSTAAFWRAGGAGLDLRDHGILHLECFRLFPYETFPGLSGDTGRPHTITAADPVPDDLRKPNQDQQRQPGCALNLHAG